jgi:hypothetical protein
MNHKKHIEDLHRMIERSLFFTDGKLDYDRTTDALILLAETVRDAPCDLELWYIGEDSSCNVSDLIVGAYWHYTDHHGGQWSKGYKALSRLGEIFNPNMYTLDEEATEGEVHKALATLEGSSHA